MRRKSTPTTATQDDLEKSPNHKATVLPPASSNYHGSINSTSNNNWTENVISSPEQRYSPSLKASEKLTMTSMDDTRSGSFSANTPRIDIVTQTERSEPDIHRSITMSGWTREYE